MLFLIFVTIISNASADVIEVCSSCVFKKLSAAVSAARPGTTVLVKPGIYFESDVIVDRPLSIVGSSNYGSVIDAGKHGHHFLVRSAGVTIRGLELRNPGIATLKDIAAVRVDGFGQCLIANNRIVNSTYGIYLANLADCTILENEITTNRKGGVESGSGIHVWQVSNVKIVRNQIRGHRDGIYFEFVSGSFIVENDSSQNLRYGLHFMFSHENEFQRNIFVGNQSGVAVMYSRKILMQANRFEENYGAASYGLLLKDISESKIIGNLFKNNTTGFFVEGVTRTLIQENDLIRNGWAVRLIASSDNNSFVSNNFVDNTFEVAAGLGWTSNIFTGNFWSDYEGVDLDRDGIGDSPHRPARLSGNWVQTVDGAALLLNSIFLKLIDQAEAVLPVLTNATLIDERPLVRMRP
jgi:nitrous oxidase accessory protein